MSRLLSDSRWSLSNLVKPISYKQFQSLTAAFQKAAERSFGTGTRIEITAMADTKVTTSYIDDEIQHDLKERNGANMIAKLDDLGKMTKDIWNRSKYVEISIRPADESKAPSSAWAHLEFKGERPRQATYYIQGEKKDGTAQKTILWNGKVPRLTGDGYDGNSTRSFLGFGRGIGPL